MYGRPTVLSSNSSVVADSIVTESGVFGSELSACHSGAIGEQSWMPVSVDGVESTDSGRGGRGLDGGVV